MDKARNPANPATCAPGDVFAPWEIPAPRNGHALRRIPAPPPDHTPQAGNAPQAGTAPHATTAAEDHRQLGASERPIDPRPATEALVIYGCGTQGQAILELAKQVQGFCELRGADDNPDLWGRELLSVEVQQPALALAEGPHRFLVSIGDNRVRQSLFETIRAAGHRPATVCHPSAQVAGSASLGEGCMLMARVVVNTLARVGDGCLLNTASVVEHHCQIGSFVHLAPGVLLGGGVHIGDRAFLGLGAIVLPGIRVGADSIVGAGAVVLRDVPAGAVVAGNPARSLARSRPLPSPSA